MTPKPASTRLRLAIPFCPRLVSCLAGIVLPLIALLALSSLIQGCESAESFAAETGVEPGEGGGSNNGNNADIGGGGTGGNGTGGGGTTRPDSTSSSLTWDTSTQVYKIKINPQTSTITQNGNPTVSLTVANPVSGHTYEWIAKDADLGSIAKDPQTADGSKCTYSGTTFTGARQEIRVAEFLNNTKTTNYGWAQVTQTAQ